MKNVSLIEDRKNGGVFAAVVVGPNGVKAYGATGQGATWAAWVNSEKLSMQEIESALDTTLIVKKPKLGKNIDTDDFAGVFDAETLSLFKSDISTKQLIQFVETKSEPYESRNEDFAFEMEHMFAEEENISNWPITDVSLASIDVAYKMHAVQYKAKAFNLDRRASSMLIQIKGARAIWDPDMPGGGGYRCPDDTPNGGQFTNRLGTGCSFGVMRRIGRGLQAASLRDITQGVQGVDNEAQQRAIYNLGRALEQRGAKRQEDLQSKFKRRTERRVRKMSAKDKKRNGAPSFSQIYQALNPEMARRDRARIAVGNVLSRVGQDMSNAGHVRAQSRRLARKAKTPQERPWTKILDTSITPEQRTFGGRLDTNYGGIKDTKSLATMDFDSMMIGEPTLRAAYGDAVVDEALANGEDIPLFITPSEFAQLYSADVPTIMSWNKSVMASNALSDGRTAADIVDLTRAEVDALRADKGAYVNFNSFIDVDIPTSLRKPGKNGRRPIPESISNLGHVVIVDENGGLKQWFNLQEMMPMSAFDKGEDGSSFTQHPLSDLLASNGRKLKPLHPSLKTYLSKNPDTLLAPHELLALHETNSDGKNLNQMVDDYVNVMNPLIAPANFKLVRMTDDEFRKTFPKEYKNPNADERESRFSRFASTLRQAADRVIDPGSRRQARRSRQSAQQATPQATAQASAPSTAKAPRRSTRGKAPKTSGIIERFRENQNERLRRRTVAKRRTAKGRKPSPTDTRIERAAKRYRRRANRLAEIPDQPEDYTTYSAGLPDPARGLAGLVRPSGSDQSDIPEMFRLDNPTLIGVRSRVPEINDAFSANAKPESSNGVYEAIEFLDRRSREGNGVDGTRPSVEKFDVDYMGLLSTAVDNSAMQMSDVLQDDRLNGTNRLRQVTLKPNVEWTFVDGIPVAIEDKANGIYHQFSMDGKNHLFTVRTDTDPTTNMVTDTVVASDFTRDQILGRGKRGSLRQRLQSRRRVFAPGSPAASPVTPLGGQSLRARTRTVLQDKTNPGFQFGKNTTGIKLLPSYTQQQIDALINASTIELDDHLDRWRRRLGITDLSLPIDESDVQKYLTTLRSTDPKRAAMNANDWHNTLMLSEVISRNDHTLIDYLKPQARQAVVTRAGVPIDGTVNPNKSRPIGAPSFGTVTPSTPTTPPSTPGGGTSVPRAPRGPRTPSTPPTPVAPVSPVAPVTPSAPPTPSAPSPAPVSPVPTAPSAVTPTAVPQPSAISPLPTQVGPVSGPIIEPGVGNPSAGITFVPQLGMYFDSNTGEYLEDLSGLPVDESVVVPDKPIDESKTDYPKVKLAGTLEQFIVAPGVDTNPLRKQVKKQQNPTRAYTAGIFDTFRKAANAYKLVASGPQMPRYEAHSMPNIVRIDLREMPDNPAQHAEAILEQTLNQIESTGEVLGPSISNVDAIRQKLADIQSGTLTMTPAEAVAFIHDSPYSSPTYYGLSGEDPLFWKGVVYVDAGGWRGRGRVIDLSPLNEALTAEEEYRREYLKHKNDIDNGVTLDPVVSAQLENLKSDAAVAWDKAANEIIQKYESFANARDQALNSFRIKKSKTAKDDFIINGYKAELLKAVIDREILPNPFAMAAVGETKRAQMQKRARNFNRRRRAVNARLASGGRRNTGLYDNDPDVLDPWKSATPPLAPRTSDVIENLSKTHKSEGIFDDATQGVSQFTDEQILMLSQMVEQMDDAVVTGKVKGPAGTDIEEKEYLDTGQAHLATIWYYNGWDALPVLINEEEARQMLSSTDANGKPMAVAVTRGVNGTASEQIQYVNDALRGDRFIPGTGGSAAGRGEYFTSSPNSWSHYHGGNGGTIIGVVPKDSNIVSQDSFKNSIDIALTPGTKELFSIFGNPQNGSNRAAAIDPSSKLFSMSSITRDPSTGMYDQNELAKLQSEIDTLMQVGNPIPKNTPGSDGSWGRGTIESTLAITDTRTDLKNKQGMFAELDPQATVEQIQEAVEKRAYYNAWTRQHLQWMLQLAQMHRDESGQDSASAKEYNKGLQRAMRMLTHMTPENRASLMGVDAMYIDSQRSGTTEYLFTPSQVWNGDNISGSNYTNGLANGAASRILVLNRSAMIYFNDPVNHYRDWKTILSSITYPDGTTALRPGMNW
jgi:hypothetical protein